VQPYYCPEQRNEKAAKEEFSWARERKSEQFQFITLQVGINHVSLCEFICNTPEYSAAVRFAVVFTYRLRTDVLHETVFQISSKLGNGRIKCAV